MDLLGAILAGGRSSRFGSDKALALLDGATLLEHTRAALAPQVQQVVICGRSSTGLRWLPDRPEPGLGPLGGINAALAEARARRFAAVVTAPVDVVPLPADLVNSLRGEGACTLRGQHLLGYWPSHLAPMLDEHLRAGNRSVRSWIELSGARQIDDRHWGLRNVNRQSDLPPAAPLDPP